MEFSVVILIVIGLFMFRKTISKVASIAEDEIDTVAFESKMDSLKQRNKLIKKAKRTLGDEFITMEESWDYLNGDLKIED